MTDKAISASRLVTHDQSPSVHETSRCSLRNRVVMISFLASLVYGDAPCLNGDDRGSANTIFF